VLYVDEKNPQVWKALIAARYGGIQVEVRDPPSDLASKNPLETFPVLETSDGVIFEENAVARYFARLSKHPLYGGSTFEAGLIDQWVDAAANEIDLPGRVWVYPILGLIPNNVQAVKKAQGDIRKMLKILNTHLLLRTFLVGNRVSLADIVVSMSLYYLYQKVFDAEFRKPYGNVTRWFMTVVHQPEFQAVVGDVRLCEKAEVAPENFVPKESKKEKKEQPKKEQAPKKETPKPSEDDGLDDDEEKKTEDKKCA